MNLYLFENRGRPEDFFVSAVIAAETKEEAENYLRATGGGYEIKYALRGWQIGVANSEVEPGVVIANCCETG
jgi:hypothetical protein